MISTVLIIKKNDFVRHLNNKCWRLDEHLIVGIVLTIVVLSIVVLAIVVMTIIMVTIVGIIGVIAILHHWWFIVMAGVNWNKEKYKHQNMINTLPILLNWTTLLTWWSIETTIELIWPQGIVFGHIKNELHYVRSIQMRLVLCSSQFERWPRNVANIVMP